MQAPRSTASELLTAVGQLVGLLRTIDAGDGLNLGARAVLRALTRQDRMRVTDLARLQQVAQPTMTQLLTRLERGNLVRRAPDPQDGRGTLVELTAEGRRVADLGHTKRVDVLDQFLAELSARDRRALAEAVPALTRLVDVARVSSARPAAQR